jgi:hypothetical protein
LVCHVQPVPLASIVGVGPLPVRTVLLDSTVSRALASLALSGSMGPNQGQPAQRAVGPASHFAGQVAPSGARQPPAPRAQLAPTTMKMAGGFPASCAHKASMEIPRGSPPAPAQGPALLPLGGIVGWAPLSPLVSNVPLVASVRAVARPARVAAGASSASRGLVPALTAWTIIKSTPCCSCTTQPAGLSGVTTLVGPLLASTTVRQTHVYLTRRDGRELSAPRHRHTT